MARTLFCTGNTWKILTNYFLGFSQHNIFLKYKCFFFQSCSDLFSNIAKNVNQIRNKCSLCFRSPCFSVLLWTHYGPLQCFSTYFRKPKQIEFYDPYFKTMLFRDYVVRNSNISLEGLQNVQTYSLVET